MTGRGGGSDDGHPSQQPTEGEPWIGVHVLTEFEYCHRAGLIAHEQGLGDTGEDLLRGPRLDYLWNYDIQLLEEGLQRTWVEVGRLGGWGGLVLGTLAIVGWLDDGRIFWGVALAAFWWLRQLIRKFRVIAELSQRRDAALHAAARTPDPRADYSQPVNWWELLKAGFTPVEYEDPHRDLERRLAGKPWRVLHRGSLRIPVFRKRHGKPRLAPQHFMRMVAYCQLIEVAEGGEAPFGIVLFGDGYDGATVPNLPAHQQVFEDLLVKARQVIRVVKEAQVSPDPPADRKPCEACPIGRPRTHRPGITDTVLEGRALKPYLTEGEDQRLYHSPCGDRFHWVPRHDRARAKGLC